MAFRDVVVGGLGRVGLMVELDGTFQVKWFYDFKYPVLDLASVQSWEVPSFECSCPALVPSAGCTQAHGWDISTRLPRVPHPCCWKHRAHADGGANGAWVNIKVCHVDIIACEYVCQLLLWPGVRLCLQGSIRRLFMLYLFVGKRHWNNMTRNTPANLKTIE